MTDKPTVTEKMIEAGWALLPEYSLGMATIGKPQLSEIYTAMRQASDTGDDDAEWLRRKLANGFHGAISEETAARLERIADRLQAKGEG